MISLKNKDDVWGDIRFFFGSLVYIPCEKLCGKNFLKYVKRNKVKKKERNLSNVVNTLPQFEEVRKLRGPDYESVSSKFES